MQVSPGLDGGFLDGVFRLIDAIQHARRQPVAGFDQRTDEGIESALVAGDGVAQELRRAGGRLHEEWNGATVTLVTRPPSNVRACARRSGTPRPVAGESEDPTLRRTRVERRRASS